MQFAHLSDCHLGVWNTDPKLKGKPLKAFKKTIDICIEKNIDFVLISGDLFNTNLPDIDTLKNSTEQLKRLQIQNIPVFIIPGSHDFSPSGKTMISVLEKAGLLRNVSTKKEDQELKLVGFKNIEIAGIMGRKGALEKSMYENLSYPKKGKKYRIFMFHSAITDYKTKNLKNMKSVDFEKFPQAFDYYAGGHIHEKILKENEKVIAFPGKLFPCNFKELEENKDNGFFIVNTKTKKIDYKKINIIDSVSIKINAENKNINQVQSKIKEKLKERDIKNKAVCIRIKGKLREGRPSDLDFANIKNRIPNALTIKYNTSKLTSKNFQEIDFQTKENRNEIIEKLIKENIDQFPLSKKEGETITKDLIENLDTEKREGETNKQFENRLEEICNNLLDLE